MYFFHVLVKCSRSLHNRMFNAVLKAPLYFFDTNPVGMNTFLRFQLANICFDSLMKGMRVLKLFSCYWRYIDAKVVVQRWPIKDGVLKNFEKITGKHLRRSFSLIALQVWDLQLHWKETPVQVLSSEFCETPTLQNICERLLL